jgi:hypothetical protein
MEVLSGGFRRVGLVVQCDFRCSKVVSTGSRIFLVSDTFSIARPRLNATLRTGVVSGVRKH